MKRRLKPGGLDFAKTHPDPADRVADLRKLISARAAAPAAAERLERFKKAVGAL